MTALNLSHDFLSAIFGILRKFRIDIGIFFSKHIFFRNEKKSREKMFWEKMRFFLQKQILRFFSIEKSFKIDFWKIDFKWLFNWQKSQNLFLSKKSHFFSKKKFCDIFFHFEKKYFVKKKYIRQSEISSGIQKSYLESRVMNLKVRKISIPIFSPSFSRFWWHLVTCYV